MAKARSPKDKARRREYNKQNKDAINAQRRDYYAKNKDAINKRRRESYAELDNPPTGKDWKRRNAEWCRAYSSAYSKANRERRNEYQRRYAKENHEKLREMKNREYAKNRQRYLHYKRVNRERYRDMLRAWRQENRVHVRRTSNARRALKVGAEGSHTDADFLALCEHTGWSCTYCECRLTEKSATEDHIVPLSRGGGDGIENIAPSCLSCNCKKGAMTADEYMSCVEAKDVRNG